jgi:hypothetical protein
MIKTVGISIEKIEFDLIARQLWRRRLIEVVSGELGNR